MFGKGASDLIIIHWFGGGEVIAAALEAFRVARRGERIDHRVWRDHCTATVVSGIGCRGRRARRPQLYGDARRSVGRPGHGRQIRLPERRRLMLGFMLSQLALRLLSAILGGYGIFCLIMSFHVP